MAWPAASPATLSQIVVQEIHPLSSVDSFTHMAALLMWDQGELAAEIHSEHSTTQNAHGKHACSHLEALCLLMYMLQHEHAYKHEHDHLG
mmetsp:Transcript_47919/g.79337  ORF Transcript_47919/g.79337 Transcript_47919/m.79337 type:complete len:90 (-) Transcript_47919:76-345(-)